MKILKTLLMLSLGVILLGCSDSGPKVPVGTISLNMLNEDNGRTNLGTSDVYIDRANNFNSNSCLISSIGKKSGLGALSSPILNGVSNKAAVDVGYAYQIFRDAAIREFPSKTLALNINADYYNCYVVSKIKEGDLIVGAYVQYILMDVPQFDLPEYNSKVGRINPNTDYLEIVIDLPTSDFEYEAKIMSEYEVKHTKNRNKIIIEVEQFDQYDLYGFFIRIKSSYTYVTCSVKELIDELY